MRAWAFVLGLAALLGDAIGDGDAQNRSGRNERWPREAREHGLVTAGWQPPAFGREERLSRISASLSKLGLDETDAEMMNSADATGSDASWASHSRTRMLGAPR